MTDSSTIAFEEIVQDANVNFLIGSGLSSGFLGLLGPIENQLTELDKSTDPDENAKQIVRISIYRTYFEKAILGNLDIFKGEVATKAVMGHYMMFLLKLNAILIDRKNTILGRQINIFTTNVDIFLEKAISATGVEFNDGFNGRFNPEFRLSNFRKAYIKRSTHFDNTFELPVFNIMKLHGSVTWTAGDNNSIVFTNNLDHIGKIKELLPPKEKCVDVLPDSKIDELIKSARKIKTPDASLVTFKSQYEKLLIVNPNKEKFSETLLNQIYYELLRIYSNELEKENSVLFVLGFSFSDEHIRDITFRVAESNPTLVIFVIAFDATAKTELESRLEIGNARNRNIKIIAPPQIAKMEGGPLEDSFSYTFENIISKWLDGIMSVIKKDIGNGEDE